MAGKGRVLQGEVEGLMVMDQWQVRRPGGGGNIAPPVQSCLCTACPNLSDIRSSCIDFLSPPQASLMRALADMKLRTDPAAKQAVEKQFSLVDEKSDAGVSAADSDDDENEGDETDDRPESPSKVTGAVGETSSRSISSSSSRVTAGGGSQAGSDEGQVNGYGDSDGGQVDSDDEVSSRATRAPPPRRRRMSGGQQGRAAGERTGPSVRAGRSTGKYERGE